MKKKVFMILVNFLSAASQADDGCPGNGVQFWKRFHPDRRMKSRCLLLVNIFFLACTIYFYAAADLILAAGSGIRGILSSSITFICAASQSRT
jgi:hypothetical protein